MPEKSVAFGTITPCLVYSNVAQALDWFERVVGFRERARYVDADNVVRQAELYVGSTEVFLSDSADGYTGPEQYLVVWVDDVDAQYDKVVTAGGRASKPMDQSWGVRNFSITDPGGYHWGFHKRLESGYQQVKSLEEGGLREVMKRSSPE